MKLQKTQLDKIPSTDKNRAAIGHLYLKKTGDLTGEIQATDGACAIRVPVELEATDTEGYLPVDIVKKAERNRVSKAWEITASVNGSIQYPNGASEPRPTEDQLSKWPDFNQIEPNKPTDFSVAINAELLFNLQKAFGSEHVKLEIVMEKDKDKNTTLGVIRVLPGGKSAYPEARGLIMPYRIN